MTTATTRWLDHIMAANAAFTGRVDPARLPTERAPGPAVITCMDPRINLEAIGIPGFDADGAGHSHVRIIRTIGAMADNRSLIVGLFLAGIREIVVLAHTDCGCCLAHAKTDVMVDNMQRRLTPDQFEAFRAEVGEPFVERLRTAVKAFEDPREAVRREVETIRSLPFAPDDLIVHGLLYTLATGHVEVIVDGDT